MNLPLGSTPDISVVGLGISAIDHITGSVERRLRKAHHILYIDHGLGIRDFLKERCSIVTDLSVLYDEGNPRQESYQKMSAQVLNAALEDPPVVFALYGHPLVFATPPFLIAEAASQLGLSMEVLPGVSSLDQIFVDLMLDPCSTGLQVVEATDLVLNRRTLLNDSTVAILQVGAFGSRCYTDHPNRPERLLELQSYLLHYYPLNHQAHAVFSSPHPLARSTVHPIEIGRLANFAPALHTGYTLMIPPAVRNWVVDRAASARLDDRRHLEQMTYPISGGRQTTGPGMEAASEATPNHDASDNENKEDAL